MITSLHKKIILALVLSTQIIKPMEQSSLQVSKFCEQAFVGEAAFAVASILSNMLTLDITFPRKVWQQELYFKDEVMVDLSIYSGILAGSLFKKNMDDRCKHLIATYGHDSQE